MAHNQVAEKPATTITKTTTTAQPSGNCGGCCAHTSLGADPRPGAEPGKKSQQPPHGNAFPSQRGMSDAAILLLQFCSFFFMYVVVKNITLLPPK